MGRGLSKNRILDGLQCPKLLWLRVNEPDAPELVPGVREQALFDAGHDVGLLARECFRAGVLVPVDPQHLEAAIAETQRLVARGDVPIFEASFSVDGVFVAVDALEPTPEGWIINEAKATTSTKPHHIIDLAVQVHVVRAAGLRVVGTRLVHLDRDCRYPDLRELFVGEDVTAQVEAEVARVPGLVGRLTEVLHGSEPTVPVGPHCRTPYPCPFLERCRAALPEHHVGELYRLHATKRQKLASAGIETIRDVPDAFPLTTTQVRQRRAILAGELVVEGDLAARLSVVKGWPRSYLDFETISIPIPRWDGCWPWQQVPVQFSLRVEHEDGRLDHFEHLAQPGEDPRPALALALVDAIPGSGPVLAYFEAFERGRLLELAAAVPKFAERLNEIERRIVDLLPLVREHVYHPSFEGSFSIKSVVPVLCPGTSWSDLDVPSGDVAMSVLCDLLLGATSRSAATKRDCLRVQLLGYCQRDTLAMVRLLARLRELATETQECAPRC